MTTSRKPSLRTRQSARRKNLYHAALEMLEPRQLFTVDLSATFTAFSPGTFTPGAKQPATLHITNDGTTKATGAFSIDVYAMVTMVPFDPGTATFLGRFNGTLNINASASQDINIQVPISPALVGSFNLDAVIDSTAKVAETDETNNVAQSASFGVSQPNYDLLPAFGATVLPQVAIVAGDSPAGSAQILLGNPLGATATIPAGVTVGIQVFARPAGAMNDSGFILLNKSAVNAAVGGFAPGKTKAFAVPLNFSTLPAGTYEIVSRVDTGNALSETDEFNNRVVLNASATTITVSPRTTDLAVTVNSGTKFPTGTIIFNGNTKIPLKLDIAVTGNRPTSSTEKLDIAVVAHPHDGLSADIPVQTLTNVALGAVQIGKSKTITINPTLPFGGSTNDYDFVATVTSHITSDSASNNTATTALAPLHIAAGTFDLQVTTTSTTIPTGIVTGQPKNGTVKIDVTNIGNVALPAVQHVNVALDLRPANATDSSQDILIGVLNNQSIAKLGANAKKTFSVNGTVSAAIASNDYVLVANVTPVEALDEQLLTNNSASGAAISVQPEFINLDIATATDAFGPQVLGGSKANGVVTLANLGNVPAVGNVNVQFFATTTGNIADGVNVGEKSFPVNLPNGKTSSALTVALTLPTNASQLTYTLIAKIVPSGFVDSNSSDNTQTTGTVIADIATNDLVLATALSPFSGIGNHGGDIGTATFTLGNLGTVPATGDITVTYYASTDASLNAGATNATALGSTTLHNITLANGQTSAAQHVSLVLPNPGALTDLKIFARVTAGAGITDNNSTNNDTPLIATATTQHVTLPLDVRVGNTIHFTSTAPAHSIGFDSGTFTTNVPGVTGTYFFPFTTNTLALQYTNPNPVFGYGIIFPTHGFAIGGKTYTFSFDSTGAKGTVNISGNTVYYK